MKFRSIAVSCVWSIFMFTQRRADEHNTQEVGVWERIFTKDSNSKS